MKTEKIEVSYDLTEEVYRSNVRNATGPTPQRLTVEIPVGDLTPEGREALLSWCPPGSYSPAAASLAVHLAWPTHLAAAPDAAAVSGRLQLLAVEQRREAEQKAAREAEQKAAREAERARKAAELRAKLAVWETDLPSGKLPSTYDVRQYAPDLEGRVEALRVRIAEHNAAEEAAADAKERAWVERVATEHGRPELARAAREGRKLGFEPELLIEQLLRERILGVPLVPEGTTVLTALGDLGHDFVNKPEPREGVPTARAYAVLDGLTGAKAQIGEGLPFPLKVSEISRIDVDTRGGHAAVNRTAVVVECGEAAVAVLCEDHDFEPKEDTDDDEY
jgi:hypothetical protein